MTKKIKHCIVNTNHQEWMPLIENNIHYEGVFVKSLLYNEDKERSTTILLKFKSGAAYPYHNHPGGEEVFVIEGEAFFNDAKLTKGSYLYTPINCKHSVRSESGCILLLVIPEEVEIL